MKQLNNLSSTFTLNNGVKIPCIGFGTWKMPDDIVENAVISAIEAGYRHIDTAAAYGNEVGVGRGIKGSNIPREDLFITSKLPNSDHGYQNTLRSFDESMERLGLDYLDLYLIHWPVIEEHKDRYKEDIIETYNALENLYKAGRIKAIGVSNFMIEHLDILVNHCETVPAINQVQFNPRCTEPLLREYCHTHNIRLEGWSPLLQGEAFEEEILVAMSKKYNKSIAQICIRFVLQHGVIPIPKSSNPERIKSNGDVFDFTITDEDMRLIGSLSEKGRIGSEPNVPRKVQVRGF